MKSDNLKKNFYIFFLVLISILFASLVWENINLPLKNNTGAIGSLVLEGYNPTNDTIRYVFFISFTLTVYLLLNKILRKKEIKVKDLLFEKNKKIINYYSFPVILSFIFIIFILLEFFSLNFSEKILDHFHDGTFLSPAQNYLSTKKFWISSRLTHGGSDVFYPLLVWKILGVETIGAARTFTIFLTLFLKILCVLLAYQFAKILKLNKKIKILFFTIFASVLISMSHYSIKAFGYYFSHRDIYIILFLIFFIELFIESRFRNFSLISISVISAISVMLHIDTGIYINFILIFFCLYLFIIKKYKDLLLIIFSFIISWSIIINFLGYEELKNFLINTKIIIFSMDFMHGLKYPQPFFSIVDNPDGARATRGLLLQLLAGLFILNYLISNKNIFNSKKILFVFLFLLSFIMYKNALGRSDAGHIRMSADLPILLNSFFILNYLLIFFEKVNYIKKILSYKSTIYLSAIFLFSYYVYNHNHYNFDNIKNFNKNFVNYINLQDSDFLDNKTINLLKYYKKFSKKDGCILNISYDDAMPYLFKTRSCTKYWSAWLASPTETQKDYIAQIKKNAPKYILYEANQETNFEGLRIHERIKLINSYIFSNYSKYDEFDGYIVLKKI